MIVYRTSTDGITPDQLAGGFFAGWPNPPTPERHLDALREGSFVALAVLEATGDVIGYVTALSDEVLSVFVPFLEVLPEYRNRGIGSDLMRMVLDAFADVYAIDIVCDPELEPFYRHLGLEPGTAMMRRRYEFQSGRPTR